jgi:ATP-dependent Clp protease ATP-binding subunit ClpC
MKKTKKKTDSQENLVERDLSALAKTHKISPGHGLDQPVNELMTLLTRGGKAPLLAGDMGVGKSVIVQELARKIEAKTVPEGLRDTTILEISAAGIFARTSTPKGAAELLEEFIDGLADKPNSNHIIFMRDVGVVQGSSLVPVLVRALRASQVRFIFESEQRRAVELLRSDEALAEKMHLVTIAEPTLERSRWVLSQIAEELEMETGLAIDGSACDMALRLSVKFLLAQRLPRKALELLKETVTEASGTTNERVTGEDVLKRFCSATRLPRFMADDTMPLDIDEVSTFFGQRLLGQTDALQAVLRSVALLKAGLNNPKRPLGVFLFAGPTGVGKTHLAKLLSEYHFGSADRLVRVNMADYPDFGDENVLFGNPWAQSLQGKRGELTRLLDGHVFTVLLLDEFEKAHAKCHDRFLQLFDEGQFINAAGETVPCNNALIVCTSNIGAEVYREEPIGFSSKRSDDELVSEIDRRIGVQFRPEFLNRFDAICHFRPLGKVEIRRIAQREVGRVLEREGIRARQLDVEVAPEVVELLVEKGYSPSNGARFLQREIEKSLTAALAVEISRQFLAPGTPVKVVAHKGKIHAIAEPKVEKEKRVTGKAQLPSMGSLSTHKRLDSKSLLSEAEHLLARASAVSHGAKRPELETLRKDYLAQSQSPRFWDDGEKAAGVLRSFRAIESQLGELDRLREICLTARRRAKEAKSEVQLSSAIRTLEEATREVRLAEARVAAGASQVDEAFIDISCTQMGAASEAFLKELAFLYFQWGKRRGYEINMVAESPEPLRCVLHVQGPGVFGFLQSEKGLHRRIEDQHRVTALIRLFMPVQSSELQAVIEAKEVKRHTGMLVEKLCTQVQAQEQSTGRELTMVCALTLENAKQLAGALMQANGDSALEVRRYFMGKNARVEDPRTGEATPRIKDVFKGEIDSFIAAWISRPPDSP